MVHLAGLAVQQLRRLHDGGAVGDRDCLMTQTHTEHRQAVAAPFDQLDTDAGVLRPARTRRQNHTVHTHPQRLVGGQLVIAAHDDVGARLTEILHEVENEAVVVVDDENRGHCASRFASSSATRSRRSAFPIAVRGRSVRSSTNFGTLYADNRATQCSSTSDSSSWAPGRGTTNALTVSPR